MNIQEPRSDRELEILIVDDEDEMRETLCEILQDAGHGVHDAADGNKALRLTQSRHFDVIVTDIRMPGLDGFELFRRLRQQSPTTEVIIVTNHGDVAQAVAAMKEGAYDYLAKPFQADELLLRVERIAAQSALRRDLEQARAELANLNPGAVLVGQSPPMRRLCGLVETVAKSGAATLITGESGTGKELVARMLHDLGPRRSGAFVPLNCGALPENLVEAELFGNERGAFTGAERRREGRFKAADGGTLFLDEVAELPLHAQAKLLRVLQEGTFEPLGSSSTVKVDVRIVSATHRDLSARIREGLFREDLFYRINVIQIAVPPMRERSGDLPLLVQYFLKRFSPQDRPLPAISPEAWAALTQYAWPGNVRELAHAVQHAVVLAGGGTIDAEHLPASMAPRAAHDVAGTAAALDLAGTDGNGGGGAAAIVPLGEAVRAFERGYLSRVLAQSNVKRGRLAEALGISRKTLWEKLRAYGIGTADGESS
jgi:DNA-binding NtrC family response regulator